MASDGVRAGSPRDEARPATPGAPATPTRDNVSPVNDGAHQAAPAGAGGNQTGNVSSFEEGDDNVAEKGGAAAGLTKGQKVKRHFARFKWWYLAAAIILLAIILPIIFKVIIPALVKNIVDDQDLPVKAGRLNALTPKKLEMELNTILDTPLSTKIDPLGLQLRMPGKGDGPFVTVKIGEQEVDGETEVIFPNQEVDIVDEEQLTDWFNEFFDKETVDLRVVVPELTANLGALTYKVELDKVIKVPGLNYLEGFGTKSMEFMMPPNEKGENLKGKLNIPNAGTLTLGLGTLAFYMKAGDVELGLVSVPDLVLEPGDNEAEFSGEFYFDKLIPNLPDILSSQGTAVSDGVISLNSTGNATIAADGSNIPYLEGVLNTKSIPFEIPITELLSDLMTIGDGGGGGESGGLLDALGGDGDMLKTLGDAIGNEDLFNGMLDHFEKPR